MKADRKGTFLATEIDRALSSTANQNLPQLVIKMKLVHWFDEALNGGAGDWVDFSDFDMETVGYFLLVFNGKNGPETTLTYEQLMKVYGWDGKDFQTLTEMAAPEMFMVRIEDNDPEYADKNPYVVNWIDEATADPRGGLKKLDAAGIANLQSQFGALLNKAGKAAPPVSAKKAPKAPLAVPASTGTEARPPKQTAAQKRAAKKAKSDKVAAANAKIAAEKKAKAAPKAPPTPPTPPTLPTVPAETPDAATDITPMTKEEAYNQVFEMQAVGTTDEARNAAWHAAIKQVIGVTDEEFAELDQKTITGEQWYQIMHETLNDIGAV